jgi:glycosyltransferase involved in cell wall biosynthesis
MVNDLGIDNQVRFLGYIPEKEKKVFYQLAKVFVYPSFYEGYGYPVVEAISSKTLVIASHSSSLTEIESDKIIFINPYDLNDLFFAIEKAIIS